MLFLIKLREIERKQDGTLDKEARIGLRALVWILPMKGGAPQASHLQTTHLRNPVDQEFEAPVGRFMRG